MTPTRLLCAAILLALPGCKKPPSPSPAKPEAHPAPISKAFEVVPIETIYSDTFTSDPNANGWTKWQAQSATNPSFATHEAESLRLKKTIRGIWQKKIPISKGGIYRLSARVKTDDPLQSEFGLAVRPVDATKKVTPAFNQFLAQNTGFAKSTDWAPREVFWVAPDSGEINGEKVGAYDLGFQARRLPGSAWCDDLTVEKVQIAPPYYTTFKTGDEGWRLDFGRKGNESTGEVAHTAEGFADPGAVRVTLTSGVPGLGASLSLPQSAFVSSPSWTLTAVAKAEGKAVARLHAQQYDADGKPLTVATGPNLKGAGWGPVSLTFDLHPQAAEVRLLLMNAGADSARFDNVLLRPAYPTEEPLPGSLHPLRVGIYPADQIAAIDNSQPEVTVNSGQAGAIALFLSGDKNMEGATTVDVELPGWLKLLSAEQPTWGNATLQWETMPGRDANHVRYRFTNPYPWQNAMIRDMPNHWTNLLLVLEPDAAAGTDGEILIQTQLGDKTGQERRLPVRVREAIRPVERTDDFRVGMWALGWLNLHDEAAREKLLGSYAAAGFNLGQYRRDRSFVAPSFEKLGLAPFVCIIPTPDMQDGYKGTSMLTDETAMRLVDGKPYRDHLAIGLALGDPAFRKAYKKRLAFLLEGFPQRGGYAVFDLEYQGKNATPTACFHPSTLEAFRKWAKIPAKEVLNPQLILSRYGDQWADFRLWAYAEVIRIAGECLREIRPEIQTINYGYVLDPGGKEPASVRIAPNSSLRADPYVNGHVVSVANREGVVMIDALERTIPYLKQPVWISPFLMKEMGLLLDKNYPYWQISAREYRFQAVAAAAYGAKGVGGFPGQLLDADYLLALRDGQADVHRYADFYFQGKREDAAITIEERNPSLRYTVHRLGERRLLTLFNGGEHPLSVKWRFGSEENVSDLKAHAYTQIDL